MATISRKALDNLMRKPEKWSEFRWVSKYDGVEIDPEDEKPNEKSKNLIFLFNCYNHAVRSEEEYSKFLELSKIKLPTDAAYFGQMIATLPALPKETTPILKLYEALLRENWEALSAERAKIKDANKPTQTNIEICRELVSFLEAICTVDKSQTINIDENKTIL